MRTAIWDKVQSFDLSQYLHTPFIRPLELFVKFMLEEGRTSKHIPEDVGRWVSLVPNMYARRHSALHRMLGCLMTNTCVSVSVSTRLVPVYRQQVDGLQMPAY